jgi:hypothetical protein
MFAVLFILFIGHSVSAQNTKGDKPASQGNLLRFPKVRSKSKGGDRPNTRDISGRRRIRTKNKSSANRVIYKAPNPYASRRRLRSNDQAGKPRGRIYNQTPREHQRAWTGTASGAPLRIRSISSKRARNNVFPQKGPYVNNTSVKPSSKIYTRTAKGKRIVKRAPNNKQRAWRGDLRGGPVGSASASRPFVTRGRKNVYWGKVSKGEKPVTHDLTGRPVRNRNFHSAGIGVGTTDTLQFAHRKPGGDNPSIRKKRGIFSGFRAGDRAWIGDLSGHEIRRRGQRTTEKTGLPGGGYRSAARSGNRPLPSGQPRIGSGAIGKAIGRLTGRRPVRGGGSVSGKNLNNNGRPIPVRPPGLGSQGINTSGKFQLGELSPAFGRQGAGYSGNLKARRRLKGGGSISGKNLNNNGRPIQVRPPGLGSQGINTSGKFQLGELSPVLGRQGAGYSGNIKARRPIKGGGSISGKFYNNNGRAIAGRPPSLTSRAIGSYQGKFQRGELSTIFGKQGAGYSGNIKARRPPKGGGSISGKMLSNNGEPIEGRPPSSPTISASRFTGRTKAKTPKKGGGSVSGVVWNNNGLSVTVRAPLPGTAGIDYAGKRELSGTKKNYVQNPKANKESTKKEKPGANTYVTGGFSVKNKQGNYKKRPHAHEGSMPGISPGPNSDKANGLLVKNKQGDYEKRPHGHEGSLPGIGPKSGSIKASEYSHAMKMLWSYKHNPSSSKDALKVLAPGKAYARISDYQGNTKMKKYNDKRLHPDAQFAHGHINNVKEERTLMINLKVMWAKLFRKNDLQTPVVKEKEHRPRYDRREKDLWKALYD